MADTKEVKKENSQEDPAETGLSMLLDMEANELETMVKMRNMMTNMCIHKKSTLILFAQMTGLDSTSLKKLKVD